MRFEIFEGKDEQFYWRIKAGNGRVLCHSEGYKTWYSALNAVRAVQRGVPEAVIKTGAGWMR